MFPVLRQVQVACDFAKGIAARLAGVEVPSFEDKEQSFADLQARIAKTLAFINGLTPQQFDGSEAREIVTQAGTPKEKRFTGQSYLLTLRAAALLFPRHHRVRHPAPQRRRDRQERLRRTPLKREARS